MRAASGDEYLYSENKHEFANNRWERAQRTIPVSTVQNYLKVYNCSRRNDWFKRFPTPSKFSALLFSEVAARYFTAFQFSVREQRVRIHESTSELTLIVLNWIKKSILGSN